LLNYCALQCISYDNTVKTQPVNTMDGIKLIAFVILVATPICQANVYKCIVDGKVIFSQEPCADNATPVDLSKVGSVVGAQRQTDAAQVTITLKLQTTSKHKISIAKSANLSTSGSRYSRRVMQS
jgi:hypothetical protein